MKLIEEQLRDDLFELEKKLEQEEAEDDDFNQQIHNAQLEMARLTILESNYTAEIHALQSDDDSEMKDRIQILEETTKMKSKRLQEEIQELQEMTREVNESIDKHKEELKTYQKLNSNSESSTKNETEKLTKENVTLNADIEVLVTEIDKVCEMIDENSKRKKYMQEKIDETKEMINCHKENVACLEGNLKKSKQAVEALQEEIATLRTEIQSNKSTPLDSASRGNSLFAEVHDRRIHLEKKLSLMRAHYIDMQGQHKLMMKKIKYFEADNKHLTDLWEKNLQLEKVQTAELNKKKAHIEHLQQIFNEKKAILAEVFTSNVTTDLTYMATSYNRKEKQSIQLLDDLIQCMHERIELAHKLRVADNEVRNYRLKVIQLDCETEAIITDRDLIFVQKKINPNCTCNKSNEREFSFMDVAKCKPVPSAFVSRKSNVMKDLISNNKIDTPQVHEKPKIDNVKKVDQLKSKLNLRKRAE